ncbi:MAG: peptidoglycan DD-metalloendopeptidase family protein [SAR324 cluster bacterium]|nr:peptidoglycan DD-metalloendopeptidase family protein [SAR324 cluster bacterium]
MRWHHPARVPTAPIGTKSCPKWGRTKRRSSGLLDRWFTIVIIPEKTARVLRLKVPKLLLAVGGVALLILIVAGVYGIVRTIELQEELSAYRETDNERLRQRIAIKQFSSEMDSLKGQIGRLRELDYKLRIITDLKVERPSPSVYGIGGSIESQDNLTLDSPELEQLDLLALLDEDLVRLREMANYQEESFNNLVSFLSDEKDLIERTPHRRPTRGFISSNFGRRIDPFTGQQRNHEGVDIVTRRGTMVTAPADGIVTYSGIDPSLGEMVVIDHGYGVITRYGHNESVLVKEGQRVKRGDPIATVGSSGKSTGPHLHYEIRINDIAVNPLNYMID